MSDFSCRSNVPCTGLAFVGSLIIGVIAAILRITAVITVTPAFLWVVFGIAVGLLLLALLISAFSEQGTLRDCRNTLSALLTGILGSILTSVILLAVTFAATSIVGALVVGALAFFFAFMLSTVACYIKCLA